MKVIILSVCFFSFSAFACNYELKLKSISNINIDRDIVTEVINQDLESLGYYPGSGKYTVKSSIMLTRDHHNPKLYKAKASISVYKDLVMESYVHGYGPSSKKAGVAISQVGYTKAINSAVSNLPFCNQ